MKSMASKDQQFVVIGGGQAAGQLIATLRQQGYAGNLTLVTEEGILPYQRPHLSKLFLAGKLPESRLLYRPEHFYPSHRIEVLLDQRAVEIDREKKRVQLADGKELRYDKLALATGARVRQLDIPGATAKGVHYLRSVEDAREIRKRLGGARRIVLIGGGFLCLEAASVLVSQGRQVRVLELQERVMANAVAPQISEFYQQLHRARGVIIHTRTEVAAIRERGGAVTAVVTGDGSEYPADLVIAGVGVLPNEELAAACGLACGNGILVDDCAVTSDPDIVAAGDCTNHPNAFLQRNLRLESVHNAVEQAKSAAVSMCGSRMPYQQVPWFWSDQYTFRLHMVGMPQAGDQVVLRGERATERFSALFFRGGQLAACQAVNRPADYMSCRKILENRIALAPDEALRPGFDLACRIPPKAELAFQQRNRQSGMA